MGQAQGRRRRSRWASARSGNAICYARESFSHWRTRSEQRPWSWASTKRLRCSISHSGAGSGNGGADPIFLIEKLTERARECWSKLLEGKELAAYTQINWPNRSQHLVPGLDQIDSARVRQKAESGIVSLCREHIAKQLVALILPARARQFAPTEYFAEVRIHMHARDGATFK